MIYFCLGEGKNLPQSHLRALQDRSGFFLSKDETGQIEKLTGKYIMELSKLKHLQRYMTTFELDYRKFDQLTQRHQLSTTFQFIIEEIFETLDTSVVDMPTAHSMIDPIANINSVNTFHHQNGPNQRQRVHKNTIQHHQSIFYQIPRTSLIPHLKEDYNSCVLNNKGVRSLFMQNVGKS